MNAKLSRAYMDIARRFADLSYAQRRKVGCVIVKDDIVHPGYNGTPAGWDNSCENKEYMPPATGTILERDLDREWPFEGERIDAQGKTTYVRYRLVTKKEVLHAESNALAKMLKAGMSTRDSDVFVTLSPCIDCAKMLFQAGVRSVTYADEYRDDTGIRFLQQAGVKVHKMDEESVES